MKPSKLIGREDEIRRLKRCYDNNSAQLVIVYGRRRVGKTFLVNETFKGKFALRLTGAFNRPKKEQIEHVVDELRLVYNPNLPYPDSWKDVFMQLRMYIESKPTDERQVVFIDEVPWMDTPQSGFLAAFEFFWNSWGAQQSNLLMIVCGSATAWMTEKFGDNPGGLFNRHAVRIYLHPFTLYETEQYLISRGINWSRYDIVECYMTMGGIPFYLSQIDEDLSYMANIDNMFFRNRGALWDEFQHLYRTLFRNSELYLKIVECLSTKKMGMTRSEIAKATGLAANGDLTVALNNLVDSEFVTRYHYFGNKSKNTLFQLCDNYTLFYYNFLKDGTTGDEHYWTNTIDNPKRRAWAGIAFEMVCRAHIQQIKRKLGILGVLTDVSVWFAKDSENTARGAQIDLLIDRRDRVINICETKFSINQYTIDKDYEMALRNKIDTFRRATQTTKALYLTMITTYGVTRNSHSGIMQSQVTMDDLFAPYEF